MAERTRRLKLTPAMRADLLDLQERVLQLSPHQLNQVRVWLVHLLALVQVRQEMWDAKEWHWPERIE